MGGVTSYDSFADALHSVFTIPGVVEDRETLHPPHHEVVEDAESIEAGTTRDKLS